MAKRPTIIDVARASGVTDGTVSRALAGDPRVRESTKRRVLEAARKIGYRPHLHARALKRGMSGILGVFAEGGSWILYDNYFGPLLAGLALAADAEGNRLLFYLPEIKGGTDTDLIRAELSFKGIEELGDGRLDGAVVLGGPLGQERELEDLRKSGLPLVLLSRNQSRPGFSQLLSGAKERSAMAAQLLMKAGHRKLAFIGLNSASSFNQASLQGLRETLGEDGEAIEGPVEQAEIYDLAILKKVVQDLLSRGATAWVAGIPAQAAILLDILLAMGKSVPGDVSLLTFGPEPPSLQARRPRLSFISADLQAEGKVCYDMLKAAQSGGQAQTKVIQWKAVEGGQTVAAPKG